MLFSLIAVFGRWCFGDRRDDDIPTVKAFKKSHTFIYVYIATWCWHLELATACECSRRENGCEKCTPNSVHGCVLSSFLNPRFFPFAVLRFLCCALHY